MADFTPELNDRDLSCLDGVRLARFRELFPCLRGCTLYINTARELLILTPRTNIKPLYARWVDLRRQAWFILAVDQVRVMSGNELIFAGRSHLTLLVADKVEKQTLPGVAEAMATGTAERKATTRKTSSNRGGGKQRSTSTKPTPQATGKNDFPTLQSLGAIAERAGISPEQIATEIQQSNGLVFWDQESQQFKASAASLSTWADSWVNKSAQQILDQQRALLLGTPAAPTPAAAPTNGTAPTNGAAPGANKRAAPNRTSTPKEGKAPSSAPGAKRIAFKDFQKANSYEKTIAKFSDAQKLSDQARVELMEQLAQLPEVASNSGGQMSYAEQALTKVLTKYPNAQRQNARSGIIRKMKELTGAGGMTQPEPSASNT